MSAPLRLTANDAERLAAALEGLTALARNHEVRFDPYTAVNLQITNETVVNVRWDETAGGDGQYVVDDRTGS